MRRNKITAITLAGVMLFLGACAAPAVQRSAGSAPVVEPASTLTKVTAPQPAAFMTSDLELSTWECNLGGEVWVSVVVKNVGGQTGTYPIAVKRDGTVVRTGNVTLTAGASQKVYFTLSQATDLPEFVAYTISVDNLEQTVTVN